MEADAVELRIEAADLEDAAHASALVEIIDSYAGEAGGRNAPLTPEACAAVAKGLVEHPPAFVLLAFAGSRPVGAAVCLWGFSTFAGRPLVNVHDLAVLPEHRGRGIGRRLLAEVERRARARGCCKITLEVHDTNEGAKRLYREVGFEGWSSPTWFVTKPL
jgi:ribosomal protein S18 acetylase RimI-like enzyme